MRAIMSRRTGREGNGRRRLPSPQPSPASGRGGAFPSPACGRRWPEGPDEGQPARPETGGGQRRVMTAQGAKGASRSRVASLGVGAAAIIAGLTVPLRAGSAGAGDDLPTVSPDRLEDASLAAGDSFAVVDNFAWRAFIALNWPSKLEATERGVPDREQSLGDPGKRVWETFK